MKPKDVPCPRCGGHGKIPLTDMLSETLEAIGGVASSTPDIAERLGGLSLPLVTNRLRMLERLGLVWRRRENAPTGGIWYWWSRAEGEDEEWPKGKT